MDFYFIKNSVLHICGDLRYENEKLYEISFYKAVSEVLFNCKNKHIGIDNALSEMAAEKIYIMNLNSSCIIVPNMVTDNIQKEIIEIRSGYVNYNLIICLLKQLFIAKQINDNNMLKDVYQYGYDKIIEDFINDETIGLLIAALDCICLLYIKRKVSKEMNSFESILLEKYQILVSKIADCSKHSYLALCALMTNQKLQKNA